MGFGPKYPMYNKLLGMFANLPIGLPFSVTFKHYHLEHHRVSKIICSKVLFCFIYNLSVLSINSSTFGSFYFLIDYRQL